MGGAPEPDKAEYPVLNFVPKGQQIEKIYQERLRQFTSGGQYEKQNLRSQFILDTESSTNCIKLEHWAAPNLSRPTFDEAMKGTYSPSEVGVMLGPSWSTHWFRVTMTVPERFKKYPAVEFRWDSNNEGLIWLPDGIPVQGLTGGGERTEWKFPKAWLDGGEHVFYVEVACNGMFGNAPGGDSIQPPDPNRYFKLSTAAIVAPNLEALALYIDFWILTDGAREFPGDGWEKHEALQVGIQIMDAFIAGDQESIRRCRKIAQKIIGPLVDSSRVYDTDKETLVYATGHCHIDSCWLWPFAETKRKVCRSWVTQMNLMDEYPEHRFTCSSAQQYKWLETLYPKAFDRLKEKVRDGKFQYIGGSWVEHDTNLPSGESLTRQFILGQRYFQSRFGKRCSTFWLPDTFGYNAQLPQLCRLSGMSRFMTQKLSWNNINKFPHTTFNWIALDGSQVICHMPPSETYTAGAHFGDVKRSITQHKSLDNDKTSLLVFGHGDGGGGPTAEMLEKLRRCRGISDTVGVLPRVKMGNSVDDFFARLEEKIANGVDLATWYGELYFELHRGTYTTQVNNKKSNREAENFLRDLEYLATLASVHNRHYKYPKRDIDDLWEIICLCQFHDCLPGSSIEMVYRESDEYYKELFKRGNNLLKEASKALKFGLAPDAKAKVFALNTMPWGRTDVVHTDLEADFGVDCQIVGDSKYTIVSSPGQGLATGMQVRASVSVTEVDVGIFQMQNDVLTVQIDGGRILSLYDHRADREIIPLGMEGNKLVIFDDKPLYWQAWDVEVYHLETRQEIPKGKVSILEQGPLRAALLVETKISDVSWIKTIISLSPSSCDSGGYLEFRNEIEWNETMKFLKVEFPVDIHNTEASYETQYGIIRRPTHYNTSWDMAKFEVCCHKWADLSENGFGVSILNDCKYGFATVGNVMRLSLIRAPKAPDAHADMGRHTFRYAIYPHNGLSSCTVRTAASFNNPMRMAYTSAENVQNLSRILSSTVSISGSPSIVLDTVKRGEDDEDVSLRDGLPIRRGRSVIIRCYDSMGGRAVGYIETTLSVAKIWKTNLLEDDLEEIPLSHTSGSSSGFKAKIVLRPFEVATYRLQLA